MNPIQDPNLPVRRQSPLGTASLVSSIVSAIMIIGLFPLMSFLDRYKIEVSEPWKSMGALYMPLAALLALCSAGAGIAGLFEKNRRKSHAVIGLILSACSVLMLIGVVALVVAFAARSNP